MKPNEIKAAMVRAGIKQAEIADELGIQRASVNDVINRGKTSYRVMDLIAAKLGKEPRKLWGERYRKAA